MLPWIVIWAVLGNIIAGHICEAFGIGFKWGHSWLGVAGGVVLGMAISVVSVVAVGLACGMILGVAAGVVVGVEVSMAAGVAVGVAGGVIGGMIGGMEFGVAAGVYFGAAVGLAFDVLRNVARSMLGSIKRGIARSVEFSVVDGVGFAVAITVGFTVGLDVYFGVAAGIAFGLTYFRLVTYPFHAALSAATYFAGCRRPNAASRAWRWCPVAWNEVIWLPLPFSGKLLALLLQQDREEGFRQIAFVATNRRLQCRAAFVALVELVINDLQAKSVSELAEVAEKLLWTTDEPTELTVSMRCFDRAARHVGQYLALHSSYRKDEALSLAMEEMNALQRILTTMGGKTALRLLQVVQEWTRLLEAERETIRVQEEVKREIPNPFVFGNPVSETEYNVFTGRQDIVRQLEESVLGAAQAPTLLLHGPRRMGKTSILNQLPRLLGPDFVPAVVDCQNPAVTSSVATMLRYLSRALSASLRRRRVTVESLTVALLEREPFAVFDEWLDKVERAIPKNISALLCLDEYERLLATLDSGWGGEFLDALRYWFQHRSCVALMFSGVHTFEELGPVWTDRFISARRVRVSFLTRDETFPLLTQPIPKFGLTYAPGALDAIIDATNCQPFLTQAAAFELVQFLNEQQRKEATPDDVEEAIARALVSGGEYFANVWSDAGEGGQAILSGLVKGETPPDFPAARKWLREHDVLNDAGKFAVPMVERWVKGRIRSV